MTADCEIQGRALCITGPGGEFRRELADGGPGYFNVRSAPLSDEAIAALARHLGCWKAAALADVEMSADPADRNVWSAARRPLPPVIFGRLSAYLNQEWSDASIEAVQ